MVSDVVGEGLVGIGVGDMGLYVSGQFRVMSWLEHKSVGSVGGVLFGIEQGTLLSQSVCGCVRAQQVGWELLSLMNQVFNLSFVLLKVRSWHLMMIDSGGVSWGGGIHHGSDIGYGEAREFSNMYDILLQECVSNDVMCSYLHSLSDLDAHAELQCLYVHKVKECECLAQKLLKQTETVSREVYNEILQSFAKLGKHSISLKLSLQQLRKSSFAKPYDVNAPGPFRNSPKHVSFQSPKESVGLNDMVHNYYLEEAKKKAQLQKDKALNTKPSVQQSARLPNTANGNNPKPRNFNQQPRN
ncbi:hypothetical protein Tco_0994135 [Tanacetum coccineum]